MKNKLERTNARTHECTKGNHKEAVSCFRAFALSCCFILFLSCGQQPIKQENKNEAKPISTVQVPIFNADSAFLFIQRQVDFGPRVPNTAAHKACAEFLVNELRRFGAKVIEQRANLTAFDGTILEAINIIGSFNLENETRVLLFAHWDTRPFADNDPNPENFFTPIDGANDGGSGVGVLLEIARLIGQNPPNVGIDIIFFDAEDYGQPSFDTGRRVEHSWALGSQHWARNPHVPGYRARFGILLDMVGARNATFPKEGFSMRYAPHVVEKIWAKARSLGYGDLFVTRRGGYIVDDHLYVNQIIGIPSANIIHLTESGFFEQWHTIDDTMEQIDKDVLKAVGQTVLAVIYNVK